MGQNNIQLNPAITDPRVTKIRLKQKQFFSPLRGFFFNLYIGDSGNPLYWTGFNCSNEEKQGQQPKSRVHNDWLTD